MGSSQPAGSRGDSRYPIYAEDSIMNPKSHGTCDRPVMEELRYEVHRLLLCPYNSLFLGATDGDAIARKLIEFAAIIATTPSTLDIGEPQSS